jgi:predicted NUDIX family NTP pyrophosphohydrolase
MAKLSAGLLVYRLNSGKLEVFLAHPGGPYWKNKDNGSWSIPKGEYTQNEEALHAALREFREETGFEPPSGATLELTALKQPSGKVISAWAVEGNFDAGKTSSNMFSMEWPPESGRMQEFPEVDRGEWFGIETARTKILKGQYGFLEELERLVKDRAT